MAKRRKQTKLTSAAAEFVRWADSALIHSGPARIRGVRSGAGIEATTGVFIFAARNRW